MRVRVLPNAGLTEGLLGSIAPGGKYVKGAKEVNYLNFNLCRTAMQVSHLNNMGFLELKLQFFIPTNAMVYTI